MSVDLYIYAYPLQMISFVVCQESTSTPRFDKPEEQEEIESKNSSYPDIVRTMAYFSENYELEHVYLVGGPTEYTRRIKATLQKIYEEYTIEEVG